MNIVMLTNTSRIIQKPKPILIIKFELFASGQPGRLKRPAIAEAEGTAAETQAAATLEDLLSIPQGDLPRLRQAQASTYPLQKAGAQTALETLDLCANRRSTDTQSTTCGGDAALLATVTK